MNYTYEYPRPSVTVDCILFGFDESELKILLIQRGNDPHKGLWALPGGFLDIDTDPSLEFAAYRELQEETGLTDVFMEQLFTFGDIGRDPRGRTVSVGYFALLKLADYQRIQAGTDADNVKWFSLSEVPADLAFDHEKIVAMAIERLKGKVRYQPIGFELLPAKFTLSELQHLYEAVLGIPLDKRNFRKKILKMNLLVSLEEKQSGVAHRAAQLYSFDKNRYESLKSKGFNFEI
ncbi:MAG: NUDIX hydrolase [Verrucomicrobia bacterium]|nr:NUDIX hydrolase [Cytophagales bacterium]